ncbi:MAG: hypothetical protein E7256_07295 [Lachnospiraceae bacterium]|nr:hypothetical protein [Lachnospiraceae bacterium]
MLNNRKIRLMTRLAVYEKNEGKEDVKLSKYYKTDYVRLQILKTILSVTVGYLLILLMIVIYKSEYLIANAVSLDYKTIGVTLLGTYIILLTVFIVGTLIGFSFKYDKSRKKLARYYKTLKKLRMIYREEDGLEAEDTNREDII